MGKQTEVVPFGETDIQARILTVRGVQVMLDYDLAELYGVETKQLKRQVRRNIKRFPTDFMVELGEDQMKSLRCQFGTSIRLRARPPPRGRSQYWHYEGIRPISQCIWSGKWVG